MYLIAEPKGEASKRDALWFRVGMYVCISAACTMQFYACVCISATLVQYNPMLVYVYPSRLHNACTTTRSKCAPGDNCGLSGGRFAQQVPIASYLTAYIGLTAALIAMLRT